MSVKNSWVSYKSLAWGAFIGLGAGLILFQNERVRRAASAYLPAGSGVKSFQPPQIATIVELPDTVEKLQNLEEAMCACAREGKGVKGTPLERMEELRICALTMLYGEDITWPPHKLDHVSKHQLWGAAGQEAARHVLLGAQSVVCQLEGGDE